VVSVPYTDLNQATWQEGKMYLPKKLNSGAEAAVVVRSNTEQRLKSTCFRGSSKRLAGNFLRWNSVHELFRDSLVMEALLTHLDEILLKPDFGTHSLGIIHTMLVGWEGTADLSNFTADDLEQFDLNRRSWGFRVKTSRTDLLASKTKELTVVFEFKPEEGRAVAVVHSIYPGKDVGELKGNVSEREKLVFYDWNHPGEI
jgi:hypothetical protein